MADRDLREFFKSAPLAIKARLLVIGALAIAVILTSSLMIVEIWKASVKFRGPHSADETPRAVAAVEPYSITYELRGLSLSLSDKSGMRSGHAQFNLVFDLPSAEAKRWCELNRAQMVHVILEEGARFSLEDFDSPRGYELFKKNLQEAFSKKFKEHAPRSVLLKDFSSH